MQVTEDPEKTPQTVRYEDHRDKLPSFDRSVSEKIWPKAQPEVEVKAFGKARWRWRC